MAMSKDTTPAGHYSGSKRFNQLEPGDKVNTPFGWLIVKRTIFLYVEPISNSMGKCQLDKWRIEFEWKQKTISIITYGNFEIECTNALI